MTEPAWDRIWHVFHQAVERGLGPSDEALGELCGGDPALRREVASLLAAHHRREAFMDTPSLPPARDDADSWIGRSIGPYRVGEVLGEGGMGTVYAAEQETPVRRKVALKIVKWGMSTREVLARFEAERQALALMSHPNIASAHDAGATPEGNPYFVMEWVEGLPFDAYCDHRRLDVRRRLELFLQVGAAVQHAHQKGVIHRDLKPSNILVTERDGQPLPKVIDFGIAKAIRRRLTERTLHTELGRLVGTPAYMSPEQAGLRGLDIDTRSDVYSLGVVLYKLLCGELPMAHEGPSGSDSAEILRRVREDEPPLASARFGALGAEARERIAGHRGTRSRDLLRELRQDLDWIVRKALEKDRERRYASASELMADVRRYLDRQPVLAGPPSAAYQLRKFVERHRARVWTAAAAVLLTAVFGIFLALQTVRLDRALSRSEAERLRAEQVTHFLVDVFEVSDPGTSRGTRVTAKEILDRGAARIQEELAEQPEIRLALLGTLGEVYGKLGLHRQAVDLFAPRLEAQRRRGASPAELARALHDLGASEVLAGDYEAADEHLGEALALRRRLGDQLGIAATLHRVGSLRYRRGQADVAEDHHREALEIRRRFLADDDPKLADSCQRLGSVLSRLGRHDEAVPLGREALAIRRRAHGEEHMDVAGTMNDLAVILERSGETEEAASLHRASLEIWRRHLPPEHPWIALGASNTARLLFRQGEHQAAISLQQEAIESIREAVGDNHRTVLALRHNLGEMHYRSGDPDTAEPILRDVLARRRAQPIANDLDIAGTLTVLGRLVANQGDPEGAAEMLREALTIRRTVLPAGHLQIGSTLFSLGGCYLLLHRFEEAEPLVLEAAGILLPGRDPGDPVYQETVAQVEELYRRWGKPEELAAWRSKALPPSDV